MLLPPPAMSSSGTDSRAFTLVEMLAVMGIIVVIIAIATPAVTALKGAGDVNKTVYDVAGVLEQCRAYAMGNNTYVYLGFEEVDVTQPTTVTQKSGPGRYGRLGIVAVATKDGTQGYSASSLQNWNVAYPNFTRNLVVVGKPFVFDNVHVPDLNSASNPPPTTGNMVRPSLSSDSTGTMSYSLGSAQCISATPFDYPIGASLGSGQYSFTKVIQFDPQGVARIQSASNPASITSYLEISLQQSRGTAVPALPTSPSSGNIAAIQVDGMTGAVHIYRP